MTPVVHSDPADPALGLPGHLIVRSADGLDAVEIRVRYDGLHGVEKALRLLAGAQDALAQAVTV